MRSIKILDCTLRDGGFVNDWNFGLGTIESIISRLNKAGIEIIEIGFLDKRRKYDENRSILPDTESIKPIFTNLDIQNAIIVAMIDFGTCGIEALSDRSESELDGIRVIFKKKDYPEALKLCSEIKKKGYDIFIQPVSVTSYTDTEMSELLKKTNELAPYGISIVDTYGLMHKKELLHYFNLIDRNLSEGISIGYHSHNNFQLAYSNCTELMAVDSERELLVDGSLYGMGKGSGNACTELLAMHLNENYGKEYNIDQLLEAIDVDIMKEYTKKYWGYSLKHFIAASNDCHPDYVSTLLDKKTLSVKSINEILARIDQTNRLTFNKELIESLYISYQDKSIDDSAAYDALKGELNGREILLLAPGKSIEENKDKILAFIKEKNPAIISINCFHEDIRLDYVFMGNAKRYSQFFNKIYRENSGIKVICTSNISESNKRIDYKLNFVSLINEDPNIRDNPVLMLLKALIKLGVKNAYIAGFDGYSPKTLNNYLGEYIQFLYCDDDVRLRNKSIRKALALIDKDIKLNFLTPSLYTST